MKYADFLEDFRQKNHDGDNYGDIIDILDRYKILSNSKKLLTEAHEKYSNEYEKLKILSAQIGVKYVNDNMTLSNKYELLKK